MKSVSLFKSGIILSFSKVIRIVVSFYTFGIIPRYLDGVEYGLITVIGSSTILLSTLDLGFGQGLRNKINTEHDNQKQASYFYSVFLTLLIALSILSILFFSILQLTDASKFFFAIPGNRPDLISASNICLTIFLINIPFSMASLLMMSFHEYKTIFIYEIINLVYNVVLTTILLIMKDKFRGDVYLILTILGTLSINIIFTFIFIKNRKWFGKIYIPHWKLWIKDIKDVFKIGKHFLLGSISYTIFFYADTLIVAQLFNLEKAGDYRILLALYQAIIAALQAYFSPLWDISCKLFANKESNSISKILNRNLLISIGLFLISIIFAPLFLLPALKLWTGRTIDCNLWGILILQIWFVFNILPYSYNMVLNGMSKIGPIIGNQIIGALLKIPLCIWLGNSFGISGIIIANSIILLGPVIFYPYYTNKYLSNIKLYNR